MSWSTSELRVRLAPLNRFKPSSKIFTDRSKAVLLLWIFYAFCSVLCLLCFCAHLFNCALWSPAGKGLASWFSFVVSNCEFVTFPLASWVRCGFDCIWSVCAYAQAGLSLCWSHIPHGWKSHATAKMIHVLNSEMFSHSLYVFQFVVCNSECTERWNVYIHYIQVSRCCCFVLLNLSCVKDFPNLISMVTWCINWRRLLALIISHYKKDWL